MKLITGLAMVLLGVLPPEMRQDTVPSTGDGDREIASVPFGIGERLEYRVKFGPLTVGEAFMEVVGLDSVAGHPTYHLRSVIRGGTIVYRLNDQQESWLDVYELASRRYRQDSQQGSYERFREYEIDLETQSYVRDDGVTGSVPEAALDEAAFIYFVRTVPLEVGETYEWNRYFRFDRNPVILQVLRREVVEVPAGEYNTIVVRPIIKTGGIFSEGGEAQIYITDDERRLPVKMDSKLKVGSLTLELTDYSKGENLTKQMLAGAN